MSKDCKSSGKKCCVCITKISRNHHYVKDFHIKNCRDEKYENEFHTIYDILENLGLLHYEIDNVENAIICNQCKKAALNFFDFKISTKKAQQKFKSRSSEINKQTDFIKNCMRSSHYDTLKNYIIKNTIKSIDINKRYELIIKPLNLEVKTEVTNEIPGDMSFMDNSVKSEKHDDFELELDTVMSDKSDRNGISSTQINEEKIDEVEINNEDDLFAMNFNTENENKTGVIKTVINNIEFISRIPKCLVDLQNKKNEIEESGSTNIPKLDQWRIVQRQAKVRGESYITRNGKIMRARKIQPACNCKFQCSEKVSESDRYKNFENHWNLGDFALQKKFLFEHRKTEPIARRRGRCKYPKLRDYSSKFFLDTYNEDGSFKGQEKVCETMFCATFDICKNNLRTLQKKVVSGKVQDMRGQSRRELTPGHLLAIDHVKQFPYFHIDQQQMTVRQIYKRYLEECVNKRIKNVKENTFRKIFSDYNETDFLKQQKKKVRCHTCADFYKSSEDQQAEMQTSFDQHIRNNEQCKIRLRWRKSGQAKKERRRLLKEKEIHEQQHLRHKSHIPINQELSQGTEDLNQQRDLKFSQWITPLQKSEVLDKTRNP